MIQWYDTLLITYSVYLCLLPAQVSGGTYLFLIDQNILTTNKIGHFLCVYQYQDQGTTLSILPLEDKCKECVDYGYSLTVCWKLY